jgi:hypothetical protein
MRHELPDLYRYLHICGPLSLPQYMRSDAHLLVISNGDYRRAPMGHFVGQPLQDILSTSFPKCREKDKQKLHGTAFRSNCVPVVISSISTSSVIANAQMAAPSRSIRPKASGRSQRRMCEFRMTLELKDKTWGGNAAGTRPRLEWAAFAQRDGSICFDA